MAEEDPKSPKGRLTVRDMGNGAGAMSNRQQQDCFRERWWHWDVRCGDFCPCKEAGPAQATCRNGRPWASSQSKSMAYCTPGGISWISGTQHSKNAGSQ